MSTELAVMPTTLVAVTGEQYHEQSGKLVEWVRSKVAQVESELGEVDRAEVAARARDFRPEVYARMRRRLMASRTWYEKLIAGLESGLTLMPDLPMRLFAIRTNRKTPPKVPTNVEGQTHEWNARGHAALVGQPLPIGEGEYVSAVAERENTASWTETNKEGKTIGHLLFENTAHQAIALPVTLTKPELIEAVGQAMERKLFDEIGICEPSRVGGRGDPLIMGRIYRDGRRQKAVCFVIGWFVNVRDLV